MEQLGTPLMWSVIAAAVFVVGAAMVFYGLRKKSDAAPSFDEVAGVLKKDWDRTGKMDFYVAEPESAVPQPLTLRVEEKKIVENAMGEDVVQLRWRLATVEEAKQVIACWNRNGVTSEEVAGRPVRVLSSTR